MVFSTKIRASPQKKTTTKLNHYVKSSWCFVLFFKSVIKRVCLPGNRTTIATVVVVVAADP